MEQNAIKILFDLILQPAAKRKQKVIIFHLFCLHLIILDVNGIYIDYEKVGYMVYDLNPPFKTTEDNVTVGFKTYSQSGTILDFVTTTGTHWGVKIVSFIP